MRYLVLVPAVLVLGFGQRAISQISEERGQGGQYKYSMELTFKGLRTKDKAENGLRDSIKSLLLGGVLYQTYTTFASKPNPDAYVIVTVAGGDTFLIPRKLKQIDDRSTLVNFTCPEDWKDKDLLIEVWRDNAQSDAFWKTVLSTLSVDVQANAGGTFLVMNAVPVEVSGKVRVKLENDTFKKLTLVHDELLATCKVKLPSEASKSKEKLVSSIGLLGTIQAVSMGDVELQNYGLMLPKKPR